MKITKLGHCCLIIEVDGVRILTDPGEYSTLQNEVKNIDIILITHEHSDHLHVDSLKTVLANNQNAIVVTNTSVGKILDVEKIAYTKIEEGENGTIKNVLFEGFGHDHEEIYQQFGQVENTGYFIQNKFFYPGDAFTNPGKAVDILALPVAGPWMRLKQAVEYAKEIKPRVCFPVHDGMLIAGRAGSVNSAPLEPLKELGIQFVVLEENKEIDL